MKKLLFFMWVCCLGLPFGVLSAQTSTSHVPTIIVEGHPWVPLDWCERDPACDPLPDDPGVLEDTTKGFAEIVRKAMKDAGEDFVPLCTDQNNWTEACGGDGVDPALKQASKLAEQQGINWGQILTQGNNGNNTLVPNYGLNSNVASDLCYFDGMRWICPTPQVCPHGGIWPWCNPAPACPNGGVWPWCNIVTPPPVCMGLHCPRPIQPDCIGPGCPRIFDFNEDTWRDIITNPLTNPGRDRLMRGAPGFAIVPMMPTQ